MFVWISKEHAETLHEAVLQILDTLQRIQENTDECARLTIELNHIIAEKRK